MSYGIWNFKIFLLLYRERKLGGEEQKVEEKEREEERHTRGREREWEEINIKEEIRAKEKKEKKENWKMDIRLLVKSNISNSSPI